MAKIRVVLVDDHPLFRGGVADALACDAAIQVVAQGATAGEAIALSVSFLPDILLLDVGLPGGGLHAVQAVARACPATKIVMLTVSEENLVPALQAGACGYVLTGVSGGELRSIVHGVMAGAAYVTPSLAAGVRPDLSAPVSPSSPMRNPLEALSERERQILEQLAKGRSNREIGQILGLTEKTVKHYMTNILEKLHVHNRVEAALLAQKMGDAHQG